MNCLACGHGNPDRAKFCLECGTALQLRCTQCQTELPAGARFCLECGTPVAASAKTPGAAAAVAPERSPADYTPKHLAGSKERSAPVAVTLAQSGEDRAGFRTRFWQSVRLRDAVV